jgi:hypothetical protein
MMTKLDELLKMWVSDCNIDRTALTTYLEADEDMNRCAAQKAIHDEIVDVCTSIIKELNSRTYQLRDFIQWERFIQGV